MGVRYARATELAAHFELETVSIHRTSGLNYLYLAHWLAQCWIPVECIEGSMTLSEFKGLCEKAGMINGH